MFESVLVANRGEIAVRVLATLGELGIRSVAVYSDADAEALHVSEADLALHIGPTPAARSYLSIERILEAARRSGAEAIHPGYGFLAENPGFARACADAGVVFIGPPPDVIEMMGDKIRAKRTVEKAGVPVVPGVHRPWMSDADLAAAAPEVGFPLLVKAAAGGGGKGMRVVASAEGLGEALAAARREALGAFGDDGLLLERYLERPRHIEVQVFADAYGNVVHLGERECSLQRRHQKVVEECPSPFVDEALRQRMGKAAVEVARACGYVGAGTVEFIVASGDPERFYFLEMNTRLQVEHPVTEAVYDVDLVEWQLRVAAGERLPLTQDDLEPEGHAVEARVYAEDPARGFLPTGGRILRAFEPVSLRTDSGVESGTVVGAAYDPLLAKIVGTGSDRGEALRRLRHGLGWAAYPGVTTNIEFLRALLAHPDVEAGRLDTGLIERELEGLIDRQVPDVVLATAVLARLAELEPAGPVVDPFDVPGGWRVGEHAWMTLRLHCGGRDATVRVRGRAAGAEVAVDDRPPSPATVRLDSPVLVTVVVAGERCVSRYVPDGDVVWLCPTDGGIWAVREEDELTAARHDGGSAETGPLVAPLPGTVILVAVAEGQQVKAGETLLVVEAMKMEHAIVAPVDGVVTTLAVRRGQSVAIDETLAVVEPG